MGRSAEHRLGQFLSAKSENKDMNLKHSIIVVWVVSLLPVVAHAEPTAPEGNSTWINLFWSILPFFILGLLFYWFIRWIQGSKNPRIKKYDEHMARQVQHMERVEQSLERIAKLLEKKG